MKGSEHSLVNNVMRPVDRDGTNQEVGTDFRSCIEDVKSEIVLSIVQK